MKILLIVLILIIGIGFTLLGLLHPELKQNEKGGGLTGFGVVIICWGIWTAYIHIDS